MIVFALMMLPGLLLLIFVVMQFIYRGKKEVEAADHRAHAKCARCGQYLRGELTANCPACGAPGSLDVSDLPDA